jgi:signal-transduction protein with cAMP-binding, CBS, and nucleotidyltransferase domain
MRKVSDILCRKGTHIATVPPETTVIDALRMMADQNIGSVVVMKQGVFAGIMTERDYSRKVILKGRHSNDTTVGDIMTSDFPPVDMNTTIDTCMQLMSSFKIRYLPVVEHGQLTGIVSMNDVVAETILNQQETIHQLQNYIQS